MNSPCANLQSLDCPVVFSESMKVFNEKSDKTRFHYRWIPLLAVWKMDLRRQILGNREISDKGIQYYRPSHEEPIRRVNKLVFCKGLYGLCCSYSTLPLLLNL